MFKFLLKVLQPLTFWKLPQLKGDINSVYVAENADRNIDKETVIFLKKLNKETVIFSSKLKMLAFVIWRGLGF